MSNATIATVASQPIAKLYKRCQWGAHASCEGAFKSNSVCTCPCHQPAPVVKAKRGRQPTKLAMPATKVYASQPVKAKAEPKAAPAKKLDATTLAAIIAQALIAAGVA